MNEIGVLMLFVAGVVLTILLVRVSVKAEAAERKWRNALDVEKEISDT